MKKIVFSGFMASVLMASSAAFADESATALTTKNYVDSGLRAVYRVATGAENGAVKDLQTAVGDSTGGLVKDVTALQTTVGSSTSGLVKDVADLKNAVDTLDNLGTEGLDANTKYILETDANGEGSWSVLEIENTWSDSIFN